MSISGVAAAISIRYANVRLTLAVPVEAIEERSRSH
jgi:hypothetical protein